MGELAEHERERVALVAEFAEFVDEKIETAASSDQKYLPKMATGELRATMARTEPGGGSDLQAMRTYAVPEGEHFRVRGSKTWISNAQHAGLIGLPCVTDREAKPAHWGMSVLLGEQPAEAIDVSRKLPKLGYRGVEACEVVALDLVGALTDDHQRRVPERAFDLLLPGAAVATARADRVQRHRHGRLRGEQFRHPGLQIGPDPLIRLRRRVRGEQPGGPHLRRRVGLQDADRLVFPARGRPPVRTSAAASHRFGITERRRPRHERAVEHVIAV